MVVLLFAQPTRQIRRYCSTVMKAAQLTNRGRRTLLSSRASTCRSLESKRFSSARPRASASDPRSAGRRASSANYRDREVEVLAAAAAAAKHDPSFGIAA